MIGTRGEVDPAAKLPLMAKSVDLSSLGPILEASWDVVTRVLIQARM